MTPEEIKSCLDALIHEEIAVAIAADARKRLLEHFASGGKVPGFKAARNVSRERHWIHEGKAAEALATRLAEHGIEASQIMDTPRLKSVPQIQKMFGRELVAGLFHNPPRDVVIVPEDSDLEEAEYAT
jgi:hypothetical protein